MTYNKEKIKNAIPAEIAELRIYAETDSTNTEAKKYALSGGSAPSLFVADRQTAGRGRMGRSFYSPEGTGIYMSLLLPAHDSLADTLLMTSAAAVAVRRAIRAVTGRETDIKWVNDLYLGGRKVCGILCELIARENEKMIIVGVGINLSTADFPSDIADIAGSLGVSEVDARNALCAACATELYNVWKELPSADFIEEYKQYSMVLGKEIRYVENGKSYEGIAVDIDNRGRLYVKDKDESTHILASGEISVRVRN
ncbi:MAG: biotin--[Clostridia bacterium]|nr:biotin--[acetyl-CoA-carboxylase] ligase [Clostridia bacterium]